MSENRSDGVPDVHSQDVTHVWVIEEGVRAQVVSMGAYVTTVRYTVNGIDYEVMLENDEFYVMEETYEPGLGCGFSLDDEDKE